jgi:hypothetical protein
MGGLVEVPLLSTAVFWVRIQTTLNDQEDAHQKMPKKAVRSLAVGFYTFKIYTLLDRAIVYINNVQSLL